MGNIADYRDQQRGNEFESTKIRKPLLHKTKDGKTVDVRGVSDKYPKMEDSHLLNTIAYVKRRAKEGIMIREGGGSDADSFWYDEETLSYKQGLKYLCYKKYLKEAEKRGLL